MVLQMTQIGEESGSLDDMLGKIADFYEREVDDAVAALSSLLEPIIIVFLGRRDRRPRRRDVPADLQARRGRLTFRGARPCRQRPRAAEMRGAGLPHALLSCRHDGIPAGGAATLIVALPVAAPQ